ncbi:DUF3885 domain-containing protein [Nonomuraea angiospora]
MRTAWCAFTVCRAPSATPRRTPEYQILLHRHNTVLTEMFAGQDVYVVTVSYVPDEGFTELSTTDPHALNPGSRLWTKVRDDDDSDPGGTMDVHIGRQQWKPGILDPLLRAVAEFECSDVITMDTDLCCLYHPYDGGADVSLANAQERDQLKASHSDWLPVNPFGR